VRRGDSEAVLSKNVLVNATSWVATSFTAFTPRDDGHVHSRLHCLSVIARSAATKQPRKHPLRSKATLRSRLGEIATAEFFARSDLVEP
jgi:hypothetical protein